LNATANTGGAFVYTPPAGTVLAAGANQTLSVVFTPTDGVNYTTANKSVHINVTAATGQAVRFVGIAGVDTSSAQTRFTFEVRTSPTNGEIVLRTRPNRPGGRNGDDDRDDRYGPWSRFVSTSITSAAASNAPGVTPGPLAPGGIDTLAFTGEGRWNGVPNYRFTATAIDAGEPGRGRDQFSIRITAPGGAVVLNVSGTITTGNIQSLPAR
jgi:hypothetical protein